MTTVIARTVRGLEWVAAAELAAFLPDGTEPVMAPREVTFDLPVPDGRLLTLGTVDDVFVKVGDLGGVGATRDVPAALAARLAGLDWGAALRQVQALRELPANPRFDVVANLAGRRKFNRYDVENALGPRLEKPFDGTHLARRSGVAPDTAADLTVRLFVPDERAVAAIRLGPRPLHRRAYKLDTGPGTLHPPVAAALARLVEPSTTDVLVDPFCGDGTIAIETATAFPQTRVLAGDADPERVRHARRNAERAGIALDVREADAVTRWWPAGAVRAVATNPPWNRAVDARGGLAESPDRFWRRLPDSLAPGARIALVVDADLDAPAMLRRLGYRVSLAAHIRLAGHVSHLVLCGPDPVALADSLAEQRDRALRAGLVTEEGW